MSFTSVTLTGTVESQPSISAANAIVTLELSHQITDGTTDIAPNPQSTQANGSGVFSITVPANDDSTTIPTGTYYTVQITASNGTTLDSFSVIVPHSDSPSVDLFSLARLGNAPAASVPYVISVNGESGIVVVETVSPATSVTGPDSFGAESVVGTSVLYAREDHDHGLPAAPSTIGLIPTHFVPVTNPTSTYRASAGQFVLVNDALGDVITVDLPTIASAGLGAVIAVKKIDGTESFTYVTTTDGSKIDGFSSTSTESNTATIVLVCDGSNWWSLNPGFNL